MNKYNDFIFRIYSQPQTIFTIDEIAQLIPAVTNESMRDRLYYFSKTGKLQRLHHGIYAKEGYNSFELANKIYSPSYISLETVLLKEGVIFQYYETIFAVSYLTRAITVHKQNIQYRQIRKDILVNKEGIEEKTGFFIASCERAFLDAVYIYKDYHFDNLGGLDWGKIESLKKIYKSKTLEKRVREYYEIYKDEHVTH